MPRIAKHRTQDITDAPDGLLFHPAMSDLAAANANVLFAAILGDDMPVGALIDDLRDAVGARRGQMLGDQTEPPESDPGSGWDDAPVSEWGATPAPAPSTGTEEGAERTQRDKKARVACRRAQFECVEKKRRAGYANSTEAEEGRAACQADFVSCLEAAGITPSDGDRAAAVAEPQSAAADAEPPTADGAASRILALEESLLSEAASLMAPPPSAPGPLMAPPPSAPALVLPDEVPLVSMPGEPQEPIDFAQVIPGDAWPRPLTPGERDAIGGVAEAHTQYALTLSTAYDRAAFAFTLLSTASDPRADAATLVGALSGARRVLAGVADALPYVAAAGTLLADFFYTQTEDFAALSAAGKRVAREELRRDLSAAEAAAGDASPASLPLLRRLAGGDERGYAMAARSVDEEADSAFLRAFRAFAESYKAVFARAGVAAADLLKSRGPAPAISAEEAAPMIASDAPLRADRAHALYGFLAARYAAAVREVVSAYRVGALPVFVSTE